MSATVLRKGFLGVALAFAIAMTAGAKAAAHETCSFYGDCDGCQATMSCFECETTDFGCGLEGTDCWSYECYCPPSSSYQCNITP